MVGRRVAWACCMVAVAGASLAGCAGPGGVSHFARRGDEQALREAVATDRFPTAAELGIVAGTAAQTPNPSVGP